MLNTHQILVLLISILPVTQAAVTRPRAVLRPAAQASLERSLLEAAYLTKRGEPAGKADHICGNSDGAILNPATIVRDALAAGLPYASPTGVVFMRASVTDVAGCGPYECSVSTDALGTTWLDMPILTNVPSAQAGCGAAGGPADYSLVAQVPQGTVCTGDGGACLVMCKTTRSTLGNCAAIGLHSAGVTPAAETSSQVGTGASQAVLPAAEVPSSTDRGYSTISVPPSSAVAPIVQPDSTPALSTRPASYSAVPGPPSSSLSRRPASAGTESYQPIATIVGFSGNNGPGGLAEQQQIGGNGFAISKADLDSEEGLSGGAKKVGLQLASLALTAGLLILLM